MFKRNKIPSDLKECHELAEAIREKLRKEARIAKQFEKDKDFLNFYYRMEANRKKDPIGLRFGKWLWKELRKK